MTMTDKKPVVLAFSGGLDTSFCVPYLRERGHDEAVVQAFLAFNESWRSYVVKASRRECTDALTGHGIIDVPAPR